MFSLKSQYSSVNHQDIPLFTRNPKVHHRFHKNLYQIQPVHVSYPISLKSLFNIILPFMLRSYKWSLSLMFPHQNSVCNSALLHTSHVTPPTYSSMIWPPNDISWLQIMKLLIMCSSPFLVRRRHKYSPQLFCPQALSACFENTHSMHFDAYPFMEPK